MTGDNVTALAMMDYNGDSRNELIVGSEDFEIRQVYQSRPGMSHYYVQLYYVQLGYLCRIFSGDEIMSEITETEAVTALVPVQDGRFG